MKNILLSAHSSLYSLRKTVHNNANHLSCLHVYLYFVFLCSVYISIFFCLHFYLHFVFLCSCLFFYLYLISFFALLSTFLLYFCVLCCLHFSLYFVVGCSTSAKECKGRQLAMQCPKSTNLL